MYVVTVMPLAERRLRVAAIWWRTNRLEAPTLLENEIDEVLTSLESFPERGRKLATSPSDRRRMLATPRTRAVVVYLVRPKARRVLVLDIRRPK